MEEHVVPVILVFFVDLSGPVDTTFCEILCYCILVLFITPLTLSDTLPFNSAYICLTLSLIRV